ncbi:hypothetical protein PybrP1_007727 [[Pythium] brassicae (nom. inval.)]|nr:hypothetical protein PybrP1_007727 [[Pythium] brassicae (nom. inval.)]
MHQPSKARATMLEARCVFHLGRLVRSPVASICEPCISRRRNAPRLRLSGGSVKCKVITCSNRAKSKGVCWSHGGGRICSFEDCSTISVSNGVCWAHGGGSSLPAASARFSYVLRRSLLLLSPGKRCAVDGCGRPSYGRTGNLCSVHYANSVV